MSSQLLALVFKLHPFASWFYCMHPYVCVISRFWLFVTPRTAAHQAPLSMEFSRQEYWSGLPFPAPGSLPDPGIEVASPSLAGGFFIPCVTWEVSTKQLRKSTILTQPVAAAQSCLTPYDPMDCSPLGSSVHGILQARILEWVAISSSNIVWIVSKEI